MNLQIIFFPGFRSVCPVGFMRIFNSLWDVIFLLLKLMSVCKLFIVQKTLTAPL